MGITDHSLVIIACFVWTIKIPQSILHSLRLFAAKVYPLKNAFFFYIFFKFYFIFKLYIIVLVLPNIKMNPPQVVAQRLKRLPAMWETWVQSLDGEDPLEKEMATHSSILARRIPWTEEPGGLQSKELDTTERLLFLFYKGTS